MVVPILAHLDCSRIIWIRLAWKILGCSIFDGFMWWFWKQTMADKEMKMRKIWIRFIIKLSIWLLKTVNLEVEKIEIVPEFDNEISGS
ncbi:MAG: hypothetical protein EOM59_10695 [Clostridia bacterium]|nr:hypothetical protein [Clostridia bacterium]